MSGYSSKYKILASLDYGTAALLDSRASSVASHVRLYIIEFASSSGTMKKLIVAS